MGDEVAENDSKMETESEGENSVVHTEEQDADMMSMFASVWVKVEVDEDETSEIGSRYKKSSKNKKKRKKSNKVLNCPQCDYTTAYKNCLQAHVAGHSDSKPYSCDQCPYTTKYATALQRHITIKHTEREPRTLTDEQKQMMTLHKCDSCEYSSYFKWNLNAHKRKHKEEKQFKCRHCDYETAYRHNFLKHSKVHNEGMFYKCDKCPFVTKFEGHITRHLSKIHNEVTERANKCDMCDFATLVGWRLNVHKQRSRQEHPIKCMHCDFETFYMCESKKHKVSHYDKIYGNGLLNNKPDLEQPSLEAEKAGHLVTDINEHKRSSNQYNLDPNCLDWNSIQVLESDSKEKPFLCHMCNYTSKFKAAVQRHFQRHHTGATNRPYKCINCDFSTKTKDQIALHNKRSLSDKILFCGICNFTTNFKCQFVMHQKCHYAYKCTLCPYSCKHKYELQKHFTMMHLGNGLKCSHCDYRAARKESLLCHETIHTGIKPFKCTHCPYMSVRKCLLDCHLKRYHSNIKQDITIVSEDKIESLKVPLPQLIGDHMDPKILDSLKDIKEKIGWKDPREKEVKEKLEIVSGILE
ncbi:RE1-silencing transcription factor B-like isoform X1 [Maniola jurtina]|uniref:RE1-silencing transcription factor B-like isoform X1 n=1 Tax=Maniola jurtina TaxID=191418 RepID=UPI001E68A567|nr:RE1-silencing transcription factor B-like isoform X1 [Maniola jurtina]XP_045770873.1 RE1-silencing transcription factor B-like isoform X1 [Maniola jurtina]